MRVSARTDVGRVRTTNEDGLAVNDLASGAQIDAISQYPQALAKAQVSNG